MYKGIIKPENLIEYEGAEFPDLELATQGYGVANFYPDFDTSFPKTLVK